jgi:hypothetical protein
MIHIHTRSCGSGLKLCVGSVFSSEELKEEMGQKSFGALRYKKILQINYASSFPGTKKELFGSVRSFPCHNYRLAKIR